MGARAETEPPSPLFASAAAILAHQAEPAGPALDLLGRLGYRDNPTPNRVALLRAASRFKRIFSMRAGDAPGLVALGAEVDPGRAGLAPGGVSGTGLALGQAFESCVGEGVEYLSQFLTPADPLIALPADQALRDAPPALRDLWQRLAPHRPAGQTLDWTPAAALADGAPVLLPADLCFRRPPQQRDIDVPWPMSTGCGAGPDPLEALLHGLLELIERDAVTLWWRGGQRARTVPPGPGAGLLARLRGETTRRRTWLLDITTDTQVPVVAAAACNDDGFGLCHGFACRPTLAAAADAALMELSQMELAHQIADAKRSVQGESALNAADRLHIHRYTEMPVAAFPALHPLAPPLISCNVPSHDRVALLAAVRQRLDAVGVAVYAVNLTRPELGIPVARAIAPGLEIGVAAPPGQRLLAACARSGSDPWRLVSL